jgi:hypothetical protein
MKKLFPLILSVTGWFALIAQYVLHLQNNQASLAETTARFFTFFTILTNLLVAIYFTALLRPKPPKLISAPGTLTAITSYITMVGLIYQLLLRHIWQPQGLQWLVNELLHSVIPLAVLIYWYFNERTYPRYQQIGGWLIYPFLYLIVILIRGHYSQWYPYPFVDVTVLGLSRVLINAAWLFASYILIAILFIFIRSRTKTT